MDSSNPQTTRCSGIALLYPFLPPALRERGWWTDGMQIPLPAQAAAFIFYACTGRRAKRVEELHFCLHVCGLKAEAIDRIPVLSHADMAAAEHMVQSAIGMAPVLGNITPDGFRESFLSREGMLVHRQDSAALYTAHMTYDLLLDRLPWSPHSIHFPWLEQHIPVFWGQLNTDNYNMEISTNNAAMLQQQAATLSAELSWLSEMIQMRMQNYFEPTSEAVDFHSIPPPDLSGKSDSYAGFCIDNQLSASERLILILAIAPHVRPQLLDTFFTINATTGKPYTEFGGFSNSSHKGFIPTIETAVFLLVGNDLGERLQAMLLLDANHFFYSNHILIDEWQPETEPRGSKSLTLAPAVTGYLLFGALEEEEEDLSSSATKSKKSGKKEKKHSKGKA
ncbi:MAG: hypothetical protein ABR95_07520 [Sphingobacteriales bacterium BACL12 MAG-120813-bin55]|jgi:hypothetical protein|nr:MAG: hypothetical protein ABR95_07520 [Sphingobacteriales bacterium BACL12 MAG-120813-bin55]